MDLFAEISIMIRQLSAIMRQVLFMERCIIKGNVEAVSLLFTRKARKKMYYSHR